MHAFEALERRRLFSSSLATLRVVTYNVEADIGGFTTPRPGLAAVLEAIGAERVNNVARPIDVLALQETTSNSTTIKPIVSALNSFYGAGTYALSKFQATESNNNPTTGNGPNALIYDTKTVKLLNSIGLQADFGAASGMYRQVVRYRFEPIGGKSSSIFYIYDSHYKSGTGTTNDTARNGEATLIRADEATLPASARVIYVGDFNASETAAPAYQVLTATGQGQAFDPLNPNNADPGTSPAANLLTESATDLRFRDDYQMMTSNALNSAGGLRYVADSSHAFGNNGSVAANGSIADNSNTALAGLANRTTLLSDLATASDHLPVVADYTDPVTSLNKTIAGWDVAGSKHSGSQHLAPQTLDASVALNLGLTRGGGLGVSSTAPANSWGATRWADTSADGIDEQKYVSFGLTVADGHIVSLSSIDLNYRRDAAGPRGGTWQYQIDGHKWTTIRSAANVFPSSAAHGGSISVSLSGVAALQDLVAGTSVRLRLIPFGATSPTSGWYVSDKQGSDLQVSGVVI